MRLTPVLILVLVGVIGLTDAAAAGKTRSESPQSTSCESQLTVCERNVLDLRRQRERVKATRLKLEHQFWRLGLQKKELDNEIVVLTHQVNHPGVPVPDVGIGSSGTGQWVDAPEVILPNSAPCQSRLRSCEGSTERVREATQEHEQICATLRSNIEKQTQENAALRVTATSLKQQLASTGVTPHPSSQTSFFSDNQQNHPAEMDVDAAEIDRRVAALLVTVAPNTRRHST